MKKTAPLSMAIRSDFNFAPCTRARKKRTVAVLFQPFALTTSPDEREQKKKGWRKNQARGKSHGPFSPGFISRQPLPAPSHPQLPPSRCPESLSVSLVLSLFTARVLRVSLCNVWYRDDVTSSNASSWFKVWVNVLARAREINDL